MGWIVRVFFICCFTLSAFGNAWGQWPLGKDPGEQKFKPTEPGGTITVTGRFQMFTSPHIKGHTFMLDTETGRLWIMKKDNTTGVFSLQRIPVEQAEPDHSEPSGKK